MSLISLYFGWIPCVLAICLSKAHHSFQFPLKKAIENTSIFSFTLHWFNRKMSGKSVFFIHNHTPLLGYRILIISIRYPTIRFDLIDKVKMSIYRAALTTHKLEWLEPWGKLAELELKCSNRELVYVGNTNITQST